MNWINKDTEIYCSFAKQAGNTGCQMMNSAFYYYGLNKIYKSFSVDSIDKAVEAVKTLKICGFAITMPYKKQVLEYVDEIDPSAKIGAANTVINTGDKLIAYNTDYLAALQYLAKFNKKEIYVLGNGGYATAVKAAANKLQIKVKIITRSNWQEITKVRNSLVYNCTPLENLNDSVHDSNEFVDCIVTTKTGRELATLQAKYQFKLYTGLEFPIMR